MASGASAGGGTVRAGRPALSASISSRSHATSATAARSPDFAGARHPLEPPLGLLEVGVDQLGLDRVDVGHRVDPALGVHHLVVAVRAHHVQDRVGLADVREELVAEALALGRAAHEPGDVVEGDRLVHESAWP